MRGASRVLLRSLLQQGAAGEALVAAKAASGGGELAAGCRSLARTVAAASVRGFAATAQQAWRFGVARTTAASHAASHVSGLGEPVPLPAK